MIVQGNNFSCVFYVCNIILDLFEAGACMSGRA